MSKAFTKEDDDDRAVVVPARSPLPAGVPNYVTARGLARLRAEQVDLDRERARLEERDRDDAERARRLSIVAGRLAELTGRIGDAIVVAPPGADPPPEARFGATVTVRSLAAGAADESRRYTIVGVDEADAAHGRIAFVSPLARAVLGRRVGDVTQVRTARGEEDLQILAVDYTDVD